MGVARAVVDNVVLKGLPEQQRVGTVTVDGHEYRVYAQSNIRGKARDYRKQMMVRELSSETANTETLVAGGIVDVVLDALDKQLAVEEHIWSWGNDGAAYLSACICLNGHVLSADGSMELRYPEGRKGDEWCPTCGKRCITHCKHCNAPIRGKETVRNEKYVPPSFCYNCSQPYPWMENTLATARALLDNDDKLTPDDREKLFDLLQYVVSDPMSPLTPAKKKLIEIKLAKSAAAATREALIDFVAKVSAEMLKP